MPNPNTLARRYLSNTAWMMAARVVRLVVAFAVSVVTARYLGRELFGRLNYAISFVMLFSALGSLGLNDVLVRELVRRITTVNDGVVIGTAVVLRLLGTVLMSALSLSAAAALGSSMQVLGMVSIVCLSYAFLNPAQVLERFFEAHVQARYSSIAQVVAIGFSAASSLALIHFGISVTWFAAVKVLESAVLLAVLLVLIPRAGGRLTWGCSRAMVRPLLRDAWPLMLTGIFIMVYMRIDQVMIEHFLGEGAVGVYAVAVRLSEAWYFVPTVVASSVFPAVLAARQEGKAMYSQRLQLLYELMTWLGIAVALPTTFLAPYVIQLVYGADYTDAAMVLALYVWAGIFVFQGVARGKWIVSEGLQRYAIVFTGGACLLNIVLNAFLIPALGLNGAAWATVISCACQTLVIPFCFEPTRPSTLALCRAFSPTMSLVLIRQRACQFASQQKGS